MQVLLVGYPIAHSLSPLFQNAAFSALGLAHRYALYPLERIDARTAANLLAMPDLLGANITVPHKEAFCGYLDTLTEDAQRIGAVNTLYRSHTAAGAQWTGDNTDERGFIVDVERLGMVWPISSAVVLGAGGASRAIVSALISRVDQLALVNRTRHRAQALVQSLSVRQSLSPLPVRVCSPEDVVLSEAFRTIWSEAALIVDATSLTSREAGSALFDTLPWGDAWRDALCYDLKYQPTSPFLECAQQEGLRHANGLGMLVEQGALSFTRWTGLEAPRDVMWASVRSFSDS
jgi:shikimate dehydrogenase